MCKIIKNLLTYQKEKRDLIAFEIIQLHLYLLNIAEKNIRMTKK